VAIPVSVQVVTFNEEKNIAACLIHILRNNPAEVVVIDRGSNDHTIEIASKFGVKILEYPDTGRGYRRLQGVRSTTFEYVAFVDADDRIPKNWLAEMYSEMISGGYAALQSMSRVSNPANLLAKGWDSYFRESSKPNSDSIMVGRPALYLRSALCDPCLEIGHFAEDTEFSKYLFDRNFRQGISEVTSFREVPLSWRSNFKKWRSYGRGYSDFLRKNQTRRFAIIFHILVRIPFIRGISSFTKGFPFALVFNFLMSLNILVGLTSSDLQSLIRKLNQFR
jgi:glycosyltransferase involved in cell wall biosynthesis